MNKECINLIQAFSIFDHWHTCMNTDSIVVTILEQHIQHALSYVVQRL